MVILARGSAEEANHWPQMTQPVLKWPCHVHCHLCCQDGHMEPTGMAGTVTVTKITGRWQEPTPTLTSLFHRDLYRCARVSSWGDLLPVTMPSELPPSPAEGPPES